LKSGNLKRVTANRDSLFSAHETSRPQVQILGSQPPIPNTSPLHSGTAEYVQIRGNHPLICISGRGGLDHRCTGNRTVGSNPTLSAISLISLLFFRAFLWSPNFAHVTAHEAIEDHSGGGGKAVMARTCQYVR